MPGHNGLPGLPGPAGDLVGGDNSHGGVPCPAPPPRGQSLPPSLPPSILPSLLPSFPGTSGRHGREEHRGAEGERVGMGSPSCPGGPLGAPLTPPFPPDSLRGLCPAAGGPGSSGGTGGGERGWGHAGCPWQRELCPGEYSHSSGWEFGCPTPRGSGEGGGEALPSPGELDCAGTVGSTALRTGFRDTVGTHWGHWSHWECGQAPAAG